MADSPDKIDQQASSKNVGRVKWFNDSKGFGFIEDQTGRDIFVHYTAISSAGFKVLTEGAEVQFELHETERGPEALNVTLTQQDIAT